MKRFPLKRPLRPATSKRRRHYKAAAICLVLVLLAIVVLVSERLDSTHAQSKVRYQEDIARMFANHEDVTLDAHAIAYQVRQSGRFSVRTRTREFDIELSPNDLRSPKYRAAETLGVVEREIAMPDAHTFKGAVEGLTGSDARFTIEENKIEGMILSSADAYFIEPASKYSSAASSSDYLLYKASDVRSDLTRSCADTLDKKIASQIRRFAASTSDVSPAVFSPFKVVEMATEADFEYVNDLGGSTSANNDILSIMNSIQAIYERDIGLTFTIVFQHTWATADPYSTSGTGLPVVNLLNSFTDYWNANFNNVNRDNVHLWTGKNLSGPAGVAWQAVVCSDLMHSYGLSDFENVAPFRVGIPAHEIGHNFNATHCDGQPGCDNTIMVATETQSNTLTFCPFSVNEITSYVNMNSGCLSLAPAGTLQFSAASYQVGEGGGAVHVTVNRTGDITGPATVNYRTQDTDTFTVGCADTVNNLSSAYGRCDFATVVGTFTWAAGDGSSKSFEVPVIDDSRHEGNETFSVVLSNPAGASLGSPSIATVTIMDNDTVDGPNPILQTDNTGVAFFVRQHYLDFLGREPEAGEPWSPILRGCADQFNVDPNSPSAGCDRITVSGAFFGSPEFKDKGFYVIDFYRVAFGRQPQVPQYSQFVTDLASLVGATAQEVFARRAAFANNFVQRPEFATVAALPNSSYVMTLMAGTNGQNYNLTSITTPDPNNPDGTTKVTLSTTDLINRLNGNTLTKAQVLRAIVQSDEIVNIEAVSTFVASQYYGYLRRTPDTAGFNAWVNYLTTHPTDFRTMVNGFENSIEYRLRFGPS